MKNLFIVLTILYFSLPVFCQDNISDLLPDPFNLPGLQASGEPEIYEGDYLFDMINGGADVYFEYGFVQVVSQAYTGMTGNSSVKVEIYEMTSKESAFGILSLSASGKQIMESKGVFSITGSGYKMMQKDIYFIMISYGNLSEDLKADLVNRISADIDGKIKPLANYPALLTNTKTPCPNTQRWLYFKGNIALRNATYLDFKIPFKYSDGVFYRCDVLDYIVLKPDSKEGTTQSMEMLITSILNSNNEFTSVQESSGVSIKEKDKLRFDIRLDGETIILIKYI